MLYYVEVRESATGECVKRLGPMHERKADKVERGMLINLNRDEYTVASVPASDVSPLETLGEYRNVTPD